MKVFVSWSGGKESALSLYRVKKKGLNITHLVNMMNSTRRVSRSHGIPTNLLKEQAKMMGVSIIQEGASWNTYEDRFKRVIKRLRKAGIERGVFGDIDMQPHRDWVEKVCRAADITPLLPLWKQNRSSLIDEFIDSGFKALVVSLNAGFLSEEWLGREIDNGFISDIKRKGGIDLCGENGEFHTFVYDGPIFKAPVKFSMGKKIRRKNHWFLEIAKKGRIS